MNPKLCSDLRTNGTVDPLGIDDASLRSTWRLPVASQSKSIDRLQVRVTKDPGHLATANDCVWDSGIREEANPTSLLYAGPPPEPGTRYFWTVQVWEEGSQEPSGWAEPAFWEMGLGREPDSWEGAEWIARIIRSPRPPQLHCALFRRAFDLPQKSIASARLYVATPGFFYAWVNGIQLADLPCDPIPSNSSKRIYYRTFDVAHALGGGGQLIGLRLASGYYSPAYYTVEHDYPVIRALLVVRYGDGQIERLGTDERWRTTADFIRLSHRYSKAAGFGSETWNMDDAVGPWLDHDYDDSLWETAGQIEGPSGILTGQPPIGHRLRQRHHPAAVERLRVDALLLDFGRVMTGRVRCRFTLKQARINEVRLRYYDSWPRANDFNQTDRYIAAPLWEANRGVHVEWAPVFHLRCFRYVEVEYGGIDDAEGSFACEAEEIGNLTEPTGTFECSEPLLNDIHRVSVRTLESLVINGVITDCPHREKDGWGAECMANLSLLGSHFEASAFLRRYLADCRDAQFEDGRIPYLIPWRHGIHVSLSGGPYYGGNPLECAWTGYLHYGDTRFLSENFESFLRWMEYTQGHMRDGMLQPYFFSEGKGELSDFLKKRTQWFLGDWLSPGRTYDSPEDNSFFNTAYLVHACKLLARIAALLERNDDIERLQSWAKASSNALRERHMDCSTGIAGSGRQPYAVMTLLADFLEPQDRRRVYSELKRRILQDDHARFDTGVVATTWLLEILKNEGDVDLALQLLLQTERPSLGYFLRRGCTTFPEPWYDEKGGFGASYCHASFSGVGFWFLQALAGIQPDPGGPGYQLVRLAPQFSSRLRFAQGGAIGPRGPIQASWKWRDADSLEYDVSLPTGSRGKLALPRGYQADRDQNDLGAGHHHLTITRSEDR